MSQDWKYLHDQMLATAIRLRDQLKEARSMLKDDERSIQRLSSHLAEAEAEAKGWQAEWTKVRKREQKLRQVVLAARPLVDDDEWHERAEAVLRPDDDHEGGFVQ